MFGRGLQQGKVQMMMEYLDRFKAELESENKALRERLERQDEQLADATRGIQDLTALVQALLARGGPSRSVGHLTLSAAAGEQTARAEEAPQEVLARLGQEGAHLLIPHPTASRAWQRAGAEYRTTATRFLAFCREICDMEGLEEAERLRGLEAGRILDRVAAGGPAAAEDGTDEEVTANFVRFAVLASGVADKRSVASPALYKFIVEGPELHSVPPPTAPLYVSPSAKNGGGTLRDLLCEMLQSAALSPQTHVVALSGESGAGKSELVRAALGSASGKGFCLSNFPGGTYHVRLFGDASTPESVAHRLAAAACFDKDCDGDDLFAALRAWLREKAPQAVLLVVDDLPQLSSDLQRACVDALLERAVDGSGMPGGRSHVTVLLCGADEIDALPQLHYRASRLRVPPLPKEAVEDLVLSLAPQLSAAGGGALHGLSGGSPGLLSLLCRSLSPEDLSSGALSPPPSSAWPSFLFGSKGAARDLLLLAWQRLDAELQGLCVRLLALPPGAPADTLLVAALSSDAPDADAVASALRRLRLLCDRSLAEEPSPQAWRLSGLGRAAAEAGLAAMARELPRLKGAALDATRRRDEAARQWLLEAATGLLRHLSARGAQLEALHHTRERRAAALRWRDHLPLWRRVAAMAAGAAALTQTGRFAAPLAAAADVSAFETCGRRLADAFAAALLSAEGIAAAAEALAGDAAAAAAPPAERAAAWAALRQASSRALGRSGGGRASLNAAASLRIRVELGRALVDGGDAAAAEPVLRACAEEGGAAARGRCSRRRRSSSSRAAWTRSPPPRRRPRAPAARAAGRRTAAAPASSRAGRSGSSSSGAGRRAATRAPSRSSRSSARRRPARRRRGASPGAWSSTRRR